MSRQSRSFQQPQPMTQGVLCITKAPSPQYLGKTLLEVGLLDEEGVYECELFTSGWSNVNVHVRPSAVSGTVPTLSLETRYASDGTTRDADASVVLAADTNDDATLADLNGQRKVYVVLTIAAGRSVTFARAEYNGWHV